MHEDFSPVHYPTRPPTPTDIHAKLRRETAADHQRIESNLDLLKPTLSLGEYRCVLRKFYGFYEPLERRLHDAASAATLGLVVPSRSPLLAEDLAALGEPVADITAAPCCERLPEIETVAQIAGCVYVTEGATLGGRLIARALARSLGLSPDNGARFFAGAGAATGAAWKRTLCWLDDVVRAGADPDAIVASARETFRAFDAWLAAPEHGR